MKRLYLALPLLVSCKPQPAVETGHPPTPVRIAAVEMIAQKGGQRFSASLAPNRQVTLAFRTSGFIDSVRQVNRRNIDIGDPVEAGAVLAQLRTQDYQFQVDQATSQLHQAEDARRTAQAQLAQAQAAATKATLDLQRAKDLYAARALTKPDLDAAQASYDNTQAQVKAAQSQVEASGASINTIQSTVGNTKLTLNDGTLKAPFAAVVAQRNVDVGMLATPGSPAFTLVDINIVKATFGVPDIEVINFKIGRKLPIQAEALPDARFEGEVTAIAPVADSATRLFQIQAQIPNPGHKLKPGMIMNLTLPTTTAAEPLPAVPLNAIVRGAPGGFAVMVLEGQTARRKVVTLGAAYGDLVAVTGLNPNDRVIVSSPALLSDGATVEVKQ